MQLFRMLRTGKKGEISKGHSPTHSTWREDWNGREWLDGVTLGMTQRKESLNSQGPNPCACACVCCCGSCAGERGRHSDSGDP